MIHACGRGPHSISGPDRPPRDGMAWTGTGPDPPVVSGLGNPNEARHAGDNVGKGGGGGDSLAGDVCKVSSGTREKVPQWGCGRC